MLIEQVRTYQLSVPNAHGREMKTSLHSISNAECVLIEIESMGLTGIGYAMTFRRRQTSAIREVIHDLFDGIDGQVMPRRFWHSMLDQLDYSGRTGIGLSAVSAIDTALWDLRAKESKMPLFRFLGSARRELPLYVTGGFLSDTVPELVAEALGYLVAGYPRFKMKVGHPAGWREDIRRVAAVHAEAGQRLELMVDANQAWSVTDAIAAGRALAEHGVTWLEDPIPDGDADGLATVCQALEMSVVTGESTYSTNGFRALIDGRCADILMPDIMRCGGPTGLLDVANLCAASNIAIGSHAFTEIYAHVMAACPNTKVLEHFPGWFEQLYDDPIAVHEGSVHLSNEPGLGLAFSAEAKERFGADDGALAFR